MLRYLNFGQRWYGERAVTPYRRTFWEFQAVVAGRCAPVIGDDAQPPLPATRRLWVFPPRHLHGWTAPPGQACRIVVGHFERVPDALARHANRGVIERPLDAREAGRVERLMHGLLDDYRRPSHLSPLRFEHALLELTLLALGGTRAERPADFAGEKVAQALAWYNEHMARRPSVEDVAHAVFLSASQLRRLFDQADAGAPLREMKRLQLDRAMHLVRHSDRPLQHIAEACGFGSPSDFSRVFRRHFGLSPGEARSHATDQTPAGSRAVSGK